MIYVSDFTTIVLNDNLVIIGSKVFKSHIIIESVDSISKDERGFPLTQYITNERISRGGYTFTHFTPPSCSTADFL